MRKRLMRELGFALGFHATVLMVSSPLLESRAAAAPPTEGEAPLVAPISASPPTVAASGTDPFLAELWQTVWGVPYVPGHCGMSVVAELRTGAWLVHAITSDGVEGGAVAGVGILEETWRETIIDEETNIEQGYEFLVSVFESVGRLSGPAGATEAMPFVVTRATNTDLTGELVSLDLLTPIAGNFVAPAAQGPGMPNGAGPGGAPGPAVASNTPCNPASTATTCLQRWLDCQACCAQMRKADAAAIARLFLGCLVVVAIACGIVGGGIGAWVVCAGPLALAACGAVVAGYWATLWVRAFACRRACNLQHKACDPTWVPPAPPMT